MSINIALAGNPNCGKTTLFNALTGLNQYVGNWAGVTVEKKEGKLKKHDDVIITDLPGIYSLSPYTTEEIVARDYLIYQKPDVVLNIVDGTNFQRNLYLTTQLVELGVPIVCAINMIDVVNKNGDTIDINELSRQLGCPVVKISALKGTGIAQATEISIKSAKSKPKVPQHKFSDTVENAIVKIEKEIQGVPNKQKRWYAIKVFESDKKVLEKLKFPPETLKKIRAEILAIENALDDDAESIITNERYIYVVSIAKETYKKKSVGKLSTSNKIDKIVTSRIFGLPIFALIMFLVYYVSISTIGGWATEWVNNVLFGEIVPYWVDVLLISLNCTASLYSLIQDGIVAGVGAVLGFVPQMIVLFIFLAFLESCGYMSRVAFVMDRIFRHFGLSGKSFIPLLIGTGCGVPGIMASRTIKSESDRRMTIITTTFIPCSAKLPIIGLIAGACFSNSGLVAVSAYFIGVISIIISGIILKKTKRFSNDESPFVMELPAYHMPTVNTILHSTLERTSSFVKKAGTVIALATIIIWFLQGFGIENGAFCMVENTDNSILAGIGNAIKWLFVPLGWGGWKTAVASITGLTAKENVVSTLTILMHHSGEIAQSSDEIWTNVSAYLGEISGGHPALAGYSFLVFNLLCAPCMAAMGAIRQEMNSSKWTLFAISYQCGFAYCVSLMIFQFGKFFTKDANFIGLICALAVLVTMLYLLFRKAPVKRAQLC